jgi:signal transduction histidine kinase
VLTVARKDPDRDPNLDVALELSMMPGSDIYMSVRDTGIGIKPKDLASLFQPFKQINTGLSRAYEGTGLGLAICRRLAELMKGEVYARSEYGKGSVFTFRLPGRKPGKKTIT